MNLHSYEDKYLVSYLLKTIKINCYGLTHPRANYFEIIDLQLV